MVNSVTLAERLSLKIANLFISLPTCHLSLQNSYPITPSLASTPTAHDIWGSLRQSSVDANQRLSPAAMISTAGSDLLSRLPPVLSDQVLGCLDPVDLGRAEQVEFSCFFADRLSSWPTQLPVGFTPCFNFIDDLVLSLISFCNCTRPS